VWLTHITIVIIVINKIICLYFYTINRSSNPNVY